MNHSDHVNLLRPANLSEGGTWADFGAGNGAFALALRELIGADATIYAVDKNRTSLNELERAHRARSGSIHEGGELGYVLAHAFGAAFDNPDLLVVSVVGDGEAETGPLEGSWKSIRFLNPARDGAVLPILLAKVDVTSAMRRIG